jgi:hypothetical protein
VATGDRPPGGSQLERWISFGTTIIAPATLLSALLFYFGYVSSRSQYEYFGVDVDTIGLSTQDYVMRSPQPLLLPLLVLTLSGVGLLTLHTAIRRRIGSAFTGVSGENDPPRDAGSTPDVDHIRRVARRFVGGGQVMLGVGVALLFAYTYVRDWTLYNLVTPLLVAAGAALIVYASRVLTLLRHGQRERTPAEPVNNSPALRRAANVLIYVVVAASIFWATATIAQWSGRGVAHYEARHLDRLPSVILDTRERLFLRAPGIDETLLPRSEGQTYRYRYRHLRLLIQGDNRMFLVPERWSASDSTLIATLDGSVRVQFQFQNEPP